MLVRVCLRRVRACAQVTTEADAVGAWWDESVRLLADFHFVDMLLSYDRDGMSDDVVAKVRAAPLLAPLHAHAHAPQPASTCRLNDAASPLVVMSPGEGSRCLCGLALKAPSLRPAVAWCCVHALHCRWSSLCPTRCSTPRPC